MVHIKNVRCGINDKPNSIRIDVDTVYKAYNIHQITDNEGNNGWEYDEDQYTITEYLRDTVPVNENITEQTLGELSILFATYQVQVDAAIAELSMIAGGNNNV